ncbi:MAG: amidohydrolase family protein [Candidatus Nanopelagicaceae bacterium]|jgi:N-acetylglucosamine-6-phosphate deacetylase
MKWEMTEFDVEGAMPYFTDLHFNGQDEIDLLNAESVDEIHQVGRALFTQGTIAYQPSLITAPLEKTLRAISLIESARRERRDDEAEILGIHLEGPFLASEMAGVHPIRELKIPDRELVSKYISAGTISMVTIAPELPGAIEMITFLSAMGIKVSIGHSSADRETAKKAFVAGASVVTHLYNRCSLEIVNSALDESDAMIFLITDGSHVSDERIVDAFNRARDRIIATTDSISTKGLGDQKIVIRDGAAFRVDGTKAGSVATMRSLWERIASLLDPESATKACATHPAALLGRPELGVLEFGFPAQRAFTT